MEANETICFCKHVTLADIDAALAEAKTFGDLESAFEDVQKITSCSTGCGKCHDRILDVIALKLYK
ncbi:MAG TPA: (2Fe-2S)-binding protein [Clostridiales bacterium]|mgnify:FL=1|uniref:(2Fe-2S)-binding protein n=1 Tax=Candidatus Egerieisoma faecipullorum TaxID=2840963 RepID=A0A9D1I8S6_9CLOT|nr:(2Fe-2S)-binding protein [Clostridiales bacterium]HIU30373.1 (2Fe-2S)-binding protein [Candidatus Egerieisoma faecipullorum]